MRNRVLCFVLVLIVLFSVNSTIVYACDENQTAIYLGQLLFGNNASRWSADDKMIMLVDALYLCSGQSDGQGQDKLDFLKNHKVSGLPSMASVDINTNQLFDYSHQSWNNTTQGDEKRQTSRKKILTKTVNTVFDLSFFDSSIGPFIGNNKKEKCESFTLLLYYSHILFDYLADDPGETKAVVAESLIPPYNGERYFVLNGNIPDFSTIEKHSTTLEIQPSDLDDFGRCGTVFAVLNRESMYFIGPRPPSLPYSVGWNNKQYPELIPKVDLFNRCHLVGRQFCGIDNKHNLITGTSYLNDSMSEKERIIAKYLRDTNNHVVYRVTPIYIGNNLIPSGVQLEAYSVEDRGEGICFNVYCYNVQPGVYINYINGDNSISDTTLNASQIIPFAKYGADNNDPDLIFEIDTQLDILFSEQS